MSQLLKPIRGNVPRRSTPTVETCRDSFIQVGTLRRTTPSATCGLASEGYNMTLKKHKVGQMLYTHWQARESLYREVELFFGKTVARGSPRRRR